MTARHFGIKQTVRPLPGGIRREAARHGANFTHADLHPIPSGSLNVVPSDDDTRERAACTFAVVVLSACFLIPMVLAGIMLHFR